MPYGALGCRAPALSVTNPLPRITGALQVYGGNFFGAARSEWDSETLRERPYDLDRVRRVFEESNVRWGLARACGA